MRITLLRNQLNEFKTKEYKLSYLYHLTCEGRVNQEEFNDLVEEIFFDFLSEEEEAQILGDDR